MRANELLKRGLSVVALLLIAFALASNQQLFAQSAIYEFTGTSSADNQLNSVTTAPTGGTFSTFTRTKEVSV
jgi:hypothetical protein